MTRHSDHPLLRRQFSCPICSGDKGAGKVMCWTCHAVFEATGDYERAELETRLDDAEFNLEIESVTGAE